MVASATASGLACTTGQRVATWTADSLGGDNGGERDMEFIDVAAFPPLAHPATSHPLIVVRECYKVVFASMVKHIDASLRNRSDTNIVVMGNLGIGKSRFYVYCLVQLMVHEVIKTHNARLVVNFGREYFAFDCATSRLIRIEQNVYDLVQDPCVVRLVEDWSSMPTGWRGVSIFFSNATGATVEDVLRACPRRFILPVWNLQELKAYNGLLDEANRLDGDTLVKKLREFGGIARSIYVCDERHCADSLARAINACDSLSLVRLVTNNGSVREKEIPFEVLKMTPDETLESHFDYDFLSESIADRLVAKIEEESFDQMSWFAIANAKDESSSTAVLRGWIFELLAHRFFLALRKNHISFAPINGSSATILLDITASMKMCRFQNISELAHLFSSKSGELVYCRPKAKNFGAIDAFIADESSQTLYALQMTINARHGIKAAPMKKVIDWATRRKLEVKIVFVVPEAEVPAFPAQPLLTTAGTVHKVPAASLKQLSQFVMGLTLR